MKYCKNCSASMSDEAEFCPNCGNRVESGFKPERQEEHIIQNMSNIKKRSIGLGILFTIITCGLYGIYWMVKMNDEALELAGEKGSAGIMVILLTILTCGLYIYYWYYRMGTCVEKMKNMRSGSTGVLYIIIAAIGLGFVNTFMIQAAINEAVEYAE